jgi:hypothetical protein
MTDAFFTVAEAAELADVKPALLKLWLEAEKFTPSSKTKMMSLAGWSVTHFFTDADIAKLIQFAKSQGTQKRQQAKEAPFVDDGIQESFTVGQIASMWELSRDTIQRDFENEPGVQVLGNKNPRGKRRRITLRIPRAVMERVKKRRSNP